MKFSPKNVAFGRHETFVLRYSWLSKGFEEFIENPNIFNSEEAMVTLGVGKNMVSSIRYWLLASQMIMSDQKGYQPTEYGNLLLGKGGYDPYLEDEGTLWLVHWLIASNPTLATAWYWFYNHYHKTEFTTVDVTNSLLNFYRENIQKKVSESTLKQESSMILRMYSKSRGNTRTPLEDALDSPLTTLNLVSQTPGGRIYNSYPDERYNLPEEILAISLLEIFKQTNLEQISLTDLMYAKGNFAAPGAVFRLTESSLINKLEILTRKFPKMLRVQETAGINQLYLLKEESIEYLLDIYYLKKLSKAA